MARDYISIGPTPAAENCQQVGPTYDHTAARAECRRFLELIRQTVGPEPIGARLAIKSNAHDFGTYLEVACYYDDENETATDYAFRCETEAPENWPAPPEDAPSHEPSAELDDADIVGPIALIHGRAHQHARVRQDGRTYYRIQPGGAGMTDASHARETVEYWRRQGWIQPSTHEQQDSSN